MRSESSQTFDRQAAKKGAKQPFFRAESSDRKYQALLPLAEFRTDGAMLEPNQLELWLRLATFYALLPRSVDDAKFLR